MGYQASTLNILIFVIVKLQKDLITGLKSMSKGKSSGLDSLTKELYELFWYDLNVYFINSFKQSNTDGRLPVFQRQAIIKLIATIRQQGQKICQKLVTNFVT